MKRLVSIALFDPDGRVAPFVRRTIDELATPGTTLVATATHPLAPQDAAWVRVRGRLIERENVGLDMVGHRLALDAHPPAGFDEVVITNDTFALLEPLARIEDRIDPSADFWGITASRERAPHVQSYFVCFRRGVPASRVFADHWARVTAAGRKQTIVANEIGLTRTLVRAGFRFDVAYHPTAADRVRAQARSLRRPLAGPWGVVGRWNPYMVLADAALDARLPVVKMSALRFDPYRLGADRLLADLERRHPERMAGVRQYLERTVRAYA